MSGRKRTAGGRLAFVKSTLWELFGSTALSFFIAVFAASLSAGVRLIFLSLTFLTGVGALAWLLKREQWRFRLFFILFSLLEWLSLTKQAALIRRRITFLGSSSLPVGIGAVLGLLGGAAWFWLCGSGIWGKRWGRDWQAFFLAAVIGVWSFQLGLDLAYDINALADANVERQVKAVVEDTFLERLSWGHGDSYICYVKLQENELTKAGETIGVWKNVGFMPGDEVGLVLHPGVLGIPWLECIP